MAGRKPIKDTDPDLLNKAKRAGRKCRLEDKAKTALANKVPLPGTPAFDDLENGLLTREPTYGEMIPCELLIQYSKAGLNAPQIAKLLGLKTRHVSEAFKFHRLDMVAMKSWKENRADVLAHKQSLCAAAITPEKISTATLRDLGHTISILHNAERLERGQATQTVDVRVLMGELDEHQKLEDKLLGEIKRLSGGTLNQVAVDAEVVHTQDEDNKEESQDEGKK